MLSVTPLYTIDPAHLSALKKGASLHLAAIAPAMRVEVLARALGFGSWAALQATPTSRRATTIGGAQAFAQERGVAFDPLAIHLTLARAAMLRVLDLEPELCWRGYGSDCLPVPYEEIAEIRRTRGVVAAGTYRRQFREAVFQEERKRLIERDQSKQTLRAIAFMSALEPNKTVSPKSPSSYGIKHSAEKIAFDLGDQVHLPSNYVSHTDIIVAAREAGFPLKHYGETSPNMAVGVGRRAYGELQKIAREQERRKWQVANTNAQHTSHL